MPTLLSLTDAAAFLELLGSAGTVTETDDAIEVLDLELVGYDFSYEGPPTPELLLSVSAPGSDSNVAWFPGDHARLYVVDDPDGGVLVLGYDGFMLAELEEAKNVFDEVVPTLRRG